MSLDLCAGGEFGNNRDQRHVVSVSVLEQGHTNLALCTLFSNGKYVLPAKGKPRVPSIVCQCANNECEYIF